jgi:hypothetical protein
VKEAVEDALTEPEVPGEATEDIVKVDACE